MINASAIKEAMKNMHYKNSQIIKYFVKNWKNTVGKNYGKSFHEKREKMSCWCWFKRNAKENCWYKELHVTY